MLTLNNIVENEIKKFLNEGYVMNDDRFTFKQRLNNSVFLNYETFTSDFDSKIAESDIVVTWKVSFWLNQSGIENIITNIENLEGIFNVQMYDKHTDELKQESQKNIKEIEWKYVFDEFSLTKGGSLYISALEFDFNTNICKIKF
jgi:hypothetical protein